MFILLHAAQQEFVLRPQCVWMQYNMQTLLWLGQLNENVFMFKDSQAVSFAQWLCHFGLVGVMQIAISDCSYSNKSSHSQVLLLGLVFTLIWQRFTTMHLRPLFNSLCTAWTNSVYMHSVYSSGILADVCCGNLLPFSLSISYADMPFSWSAFQVISSKSWQVLLTSSHIIWKFIYVIRWKVNKH